MSDTSITPFVISTKLSLNTRLNELDSQFETAAAQNIDAAIDESFTGTERRALIKFEKLKLIGGLGLAEVMLRGKVLDEIEQFGLWSVLPGGYNTLEAAAQAQGISASKLSDIRDLTRVVFPYLTEQLGVSLAECWDNIGSSNFREIIPLLKVMITGVPSQSAQVNSAVDLLLSDAAVSLRVAGNNEDPADADVTRSAVERVFELGQLPNRELRTNIRPTRTPPVGGVTINSGNRRFIVIEVNDDDQWNMVQRKLSGSMDLTPSTPADFRRSEIFRLLTGN